MHQPKSLWVGKSNRYSKLLRNRVFKPWKGWSDTLLEVCLPHGMWILPQRPVYWSTPLTFQLWHLLLLILMLNPNLNLAWHPPIPFNYFSSSMLTWSHLILTCFFPDYLYDNIQTYSCVRSMLVIEHYGNIVSGMWVGFIRDLSYGVFWEWSLPVLPCQERKSMIIIR